MRIVRKGEGTVISGQWSVLAACGFRAGCKSLALLFVYYGGDDRYFYDRFGLHAVATLSAIERTIKM
jgi:hypothetical protein